MVHRDTTDKDTTDKDFMDKIDSRIISEFAISDRQSMETISRDQRVDMLVLVEHPDWDTSGLPDCQVVFSMEDSFCINGSVATVSALQDDENVIFVELDEALYPE